ncbi:MAG: MOSC domain-containing protein [Ponticaulis sp.]|nr:MOSC domain-containing protein [Ponticaulis sp.]
MTWGVVAALYRHPVKGFTPERIQSAVLTAGDCFPTDRLFAVENGPSGFDPANPKHVKKQKFTVLARSPVVAQLNTKFEDETGLFHVTTPDGASKAFAIHTAEGQTELATFLSRQFADVFDGDLKTLEGPGAHRFTDHPKGHVSLLNLASVKTASEAFGTPVDPLRFRMNIHIDGLSSWAEDDLNSGDVLRLGDAELTILAPTVRCMATHANPETGTYDLDTVPLLKTAFDRVTLGLYANVSKSGTVREGDLLEQL